MVGYAGKLGGGFHDLGIGGVLSILAGVGVDSLLHGAATAKLATWLATKSGKSEAEEYNRADMYMSLIAAAPITVFGALRLTKLNYESDILDVVDCFGVGAGAYEFGNFTEVLGSLIKEL